MKIRFPEDVIDKLIQCNGSAVRLFLWLAKEQQDYHPDYYAARDALGITQPSLRRSCKQLAAVGLCKPFEPHSGYLPCTVLCGCGG
jgi:hypothetical protein